MALKSTENLKKNRKSIKSLIEEKRNKPQIFGYTQEKEGEKNT